jgi:hypothetical protein
MLTSLLVVIVVLAPAVAASQSPYTHFVTADGGSTSLCAETDPCSLPRAVQLLNADGLPPGSLVSIATSTPARATRSR